MPNYGQTKRTFSKKLGKWITKNEQQAFDYEAVNGKSVSLLISYFRFYPDMFADVFRSENAQYQLELPQRYMMRLLARYKNVHITGCRGLSKTYVMLLSKCIEGILYPGEIMRYTAPNQKQAAALASQTFHQLEKDYPDIIAMWSLKNDRSDMFRITSKYGSEFSMYAPRGSNCHQSIGEEIGQEVPEPFDMENYERNVLPTVRLIRQVNRKKDLTHINLKHSAISNASTRQNRAFSEHRNKALKDMLYGDLFDGYVAEMSWVSALICNIRDINYIKDQKAKLTAENFLREMCARYTGTGDNPLLTDETISKSRKLKIMEERHCGDENCIYVVSHDDASVDRQHNAKCADTVIKLTRYDSVAKRDKYKKQVVFVDVYPPPQTAYLRAKRVKQLWHKFCLVGGKATYLSVDTRNAGVDVVSELMKPMNDGLPTLSCIDGFNSVIEQPTAIRCLYPMQSSRGGANYEVNILDYSRNEFEQDNVELLTSDTRDGVEQYKKCHAIKDDVTDGKIAQPYKRTDELCQQISNLKIEPSGSGIREKRKSQAIQRDIWSSLKYGLWLCHLEEEKIKVKNYKAKSSYAQAIESFKCENYEAARPTATDIRSQLLAKRRR